MTTEGSAPSSGMRGRASVGNLRSWAVRDGGRGSLGPLSLVAPRPPGLSAGAHPQPSLPGCCLQLPFRPQCPAVLSGHLPPLLGPSLCPECPSPAEKPLCVFKCLRPTVRVSTHGSTPVPGDAPPRFLLQKRHLALAPTLALGDSWGPAASVPSSWRGVASALAAPDPGGS